MDPATIGMILLVLGLVLVAAEAFSPGGYLIIPGVVLLVLGIYAYLDPDKLYTWWTPAVAIVVAIPVTALTIWGYSKLGSPEPPSTTVAESLIGKEGVIVTATSPGNLKGKVKIGSDTWSADSDTEISEGTEVVVESSEGVHVHVRTK
ncbi:MAG: NfeD family protein [Candidatus Methanomethylophilaceae archaeon]|jgi:membrane protein implicated in regulation of membrane protease activity